MKTLFLTVATAALVFAAPAAFAAHHDGGHPSGGDSHHSTSVHVEHTAPAHVEHTSMHVEHTSVHVDHTFHTHHGMTTTTYYGSSHHNDYANHDHGNGNHSHGGTHVTISFNRHNVTASRHFHYRGGEYRWPGGYHYQRWSYGMTLPTVFWAQDYWITDYSDYGLAYPPDGAVWVRYGNDAVLIDQDSGEILEVVYDQFY